MKLQLQPRHRVLAVLLLLAMTFLFEEAQISGLLFAGVFGDPLARGVCVNRGSGNEAALQFLNGALERNRNDAQAYYYRARCWYFLKNYNAAIRDASEAIQLQPNLAEAYLYRAKSRRLQGQVNQAFPDYTRSIQLKPTAEAYYARGYAYFEEYQSKGGEALSDLSTAIKLDPSYADAYFTRGGLYMRFDRYANAVNDFKKVIQLNPSSVNAYCNVGLSLYGLGRDNDGRQWLQKCYQMDASPQRKAHYEGELQKLYAWREAQRNVRASSGSGSSNSSGYSWDEQQTKRQYEWQNNQVQQYKASGQDDRAGECARDRNRCN
jgi:tetratricopeptide (TPR) repeat protein